MRLKSFLGTRIWAPKPAYWPPRRPGYVTAIMKVYIVFPICSCLSCLPELQAKMFLVSQIAGFLNQLYF